MGSDVGWIKVCDVEGCEIGKDLADVDSGSRASKREGFGGRVRCARYVQGDALISQAREAGPLDFVRVIRDGSGLVSSSDGSQVDSAGRVRCWGWEEFLVASGIGRVDVGGVDRGVGSAVRRFLDGELFGEGSGGL